MSAVMSFLQDFVVKLRMDLLISQSTTAWHYGQRVRVASTLHLLRSVANLPLCWCWGSAACLRSLQCFEGWRSPTGWLPSLRRASWKTPPISGCPIRSLRKTPGYLKETRSNEDVFPSGSAGRLFHWGWWKNFVVLKLWLQLVLSIFHRTHFAHCHL